MHLLFTFCTCCLLFAPVVILPTAAAALSRLAAAAISQAQPPTTAIDKPITALQDLCLRCVSKRVAGHTRQPITTLEALPPHLASLLVEELKKSGALRSKTLQLLLPW